MIKPVSCMTDGTINMSKKLLLLGILTVGATFVCGIGSVEAVNYTAMPTKSSKAKKAEDEEQSKNRGSQQICDENDLKKIKKYDSKFKKYIEDQNEFLAGVEAEKLNSEASKRTELESLLEKFNKYLNSEEHQKVVGSYKECKMEMPELPGQTPFWMP